MNTIQLQRFMLNDPYICRYMGGVVAINDLPLFVDKPRTFIVNTDPNNLPGKHWIVVFVDDVCEHFNSSSRKPSKSFSNYMMVKGPNYMFNTNRVQALGSNTCGLYCLFFAYFRCRGYSFQSVINMFSDNLLLNELVVKHFYELTQ